MTNTLPNFQSIQPGREDRILKLALEARQDKEGVNLVAGVPLQADGSTLIFDCMKLARKSIVEDNSYGPIGGLPELVRLTEIDIFGDNSSALNDKRVCSVITAGGTAALFTAGRLLQKSSYRDAPIYCPSLTWDNHPTIFANLNFKFLQELNYQRDTTGQLDFEKFKAALDKLPSSCSLLIQGAGNNPAGFDFTHEQIVVIGQVCQAKNIMLIYDFAYQQLGKGYEEDSAPIRALANEEGLNFIVCYSFSKRYGTFGQRVGMISVVCANESECKNVRSALMESNRACFSNPPRFGQEMVLWVKQNKASEHYQEVETLRARSVSERKLFIEGMQKRGFNFSYMKNDAGMFIFLADISEKQAQALKDQHHIHGVPWRGSGDVHQGLRLNALGLGEHNRERLMDALAAVLRG